MNNYNVKIEGDIEGYIDKTLLIDPRNYIDYASKEEIIEDIKADLDLGDVNIYSMDLTVDIPDAFWEDLEIARKLQMSKDHDCFHEVINSMFK